jgi:hypothetical protein
LNTVFLKVGDSSFEGEDGLANVEKLGGAFAEDVDADHTAAFEAHSVQLLSLDLLPVGGGRLPSIQPASVVWSMLQSSLTPST